MLSEADLEVARYLLKFIVINIIEIEVDCLHHTQQLPCPAQTTVLESKKEIIFL